MNVFELFAKLKLDSSEYEQGLEGAENAAEKVGITIGQGLRTAGKIGVASITALTTASVALGGAMLKSAGDTAAYGDNIDKMSQKMGLSAEAYQEWDAIMQHSGASIDSMQRGMTTLSQAVENGSGAFEELGISLEDAASMSQEELFNATITALQNMESGTERTVLAQKLLGGSAKELGALLNTSAEDTEAMRQRVHELGGVMSNESVKAAAAYQDSLQDLQTAFNGLGRSLTGKFMPGITGVMDGLAEIFTGNGEGGLAMIADGIDGLMATLSEELPQFLDLGISIIDALATAIIDNLPKLAETTVQIILTLVTNVINNLPKIIDAGIDMLFALIDGIIEALPQLIPAVVSVIMTIVKKLTEPFMLMKLIQAAFQILGAVAQGLIDAIPELVSAVPTIILNLIEAILRFLPQILMSGLQLMSELALGVARGAVKVLAEIGKLLTEIPKRFMERIRDAANWGRDLIQNFINGILEKWNTLKQTVGNVAQSVKDFLGFSEPKEGPLSNFHTYAPDMMQLFAQGIKDNEDLITDQIASSFDFGNNMSGFGNPSQMQVLTPAPEAMRDITVILELDGAVFGRAVYRANNEEVQRVGVKLAGGMA